MTGTLQAAREAIGETIRNGVERGTNVYPYEIRIGSTLTYPRVWIEFTNIRYYASLGTCSKATIDGNIIIEVGSESAGGTEADIANKLDEYTDPYVTTSVVSILMAEAAQHPFFGGAVDSFTALEAQPRQFGARQIPFQFTTTRPAT